MTPGAALLLLAALGSAVMAGLFFVFSIAIMKALGRIGESAGIAAMQAINDVIVNPPFLAVFFGTGAACLAAATFALVDWQATGSILTLCGSLAYLAGCLGVTIVRNVPMNNELAAVPAHDPDSRKVWSRYRARWTAWNHVRTVTCLAAAVLLVLAACVAVTRGP